MPTLQKSPGAERPLGFCNQDATKRSRLSHGRMSSHSGMADSHGPATGHVDDMPAKPGAASPRHETMCRSRAVSARTLRAPVQES